jgi:O-antigen ligase
VALGLAATIAKTGSRGAFVALTIVLLAFLVSLKGTSVFKRVLFVVAIAVGGAFAAPEGYFKQMNTVTNAKEDYNWDAPTGRRQVWLRGLGYIAQYPIFGVGYANFGRAEGQISERAKNADPNGPAIKWSAAHNTYLQAIAEIGIPGGLLVCAIVFGAITIPWKLRSRIPAAWKTGTWDQRFMFETAVFLPLATLGFAVSAFFLSFAFLEPLYYLGALAGALAVFVERELRAGRAPQVAAPRRPRYGAMLQQPPVMIPAGGAPQRVYVATPMRLQGQSGPTPK